MTLEEYVAGSWAQGGAYEKKAWDQGQVAIEIEKCQPIGSIRVPDSFLVGCVLNACCHAVTEGQG